MASGQSKTGEEQRQPQPDEIAQSSPVGQFPSLRQLISEMGALGAKVDRLIDDVKEQNRKLDKVNEVAIHLDHLREDSRAHATQLSQIAGVLSQVKGAVKLLTVIGVILGLLIGAATLYLRYTAFESNRVPVPVRTTLPSRAAHK